MYCDKIDLCRVVGEPNLAYTDYCEFRSNGKGSCEALFDTPGGGYAEILALIYHRSSDGKLTVDSARFAGTASQRRPLAFRMTHFRMSDPPGHRRQMMSPAT
ncbi:MAG: hypothetical protein KAZ88_12535 [Acidimicrobiia bacterium]|jgi:hypothetical protein|nr:hypothetical protein [Acidimicrobiia bacterium]